MLGILQSRPLVHGTFYSCFQIENAVIFNEDTVRDRLCECVCIMKALKWLSAICVGK